MPTTAEPSRRSRRGRKRRPRPDALDISHVLERLELEHGGGERLPEAEIAEATGIARTTYNAFKNPKSERRVGPNLGHLARLARFFEVPVETFFGFEPEFGGEERDGLRFRLRDPAAGPRETALRIAAAGALRGDPPDAIANRIGRVYAASEWPTTALGEPEIRWMASSGLTMGLVELAPDPDLTGLRNDALAAELRGEIDAALDGKGRSGGPSAPDVTVVRNLGSEAFERDPTAPFLIARAAHRLVADFMDRNPSAYMLGIAGGAHVAAFVRTIGPGSSPFPFHPSDHKRFTIVPLTLEIFSDHRYLLADGLVSELQARASQCLGPDRVSGPSFSVFGFLKDRTDIEIKKNSVEMVRGHYSDLDVAIYSCGDRSDRGWISSMLPDLGIEPLEQAETDVCLNMLRKDGELVRLSHTSEIREFLGLNLSDLDRVVESRRKLALLLASGEAKGRPLAIVMLARCANAVICDEAAAHAALAAFRQGLQKSDKPARVPTRQ